MSDLKSQLQTALTDSKQAQLELKATQTELKTTQAQLQTTQDEVKEVKSDLKSTQIKVALLEFQLNSANTNTSTITESSKDIPSIKADISTLKTDVFQLQSQRNASGEAGITNKGGAKFTRWGRTDCPSDTQIVYKGYTGGTSSSDTASSASILCLPEHPIFAVHTAPRTDYESYILGTEYETGYSGSPFQNFQDDDMPCVVCESKTKRSAIMVPARNQCYPGWALEYWGYLMGAGNTQASAEFICVDKDPEAVPGSQANKDGRELYITRSICGSLACPPYENKWELTCVVCSK